MNSIFPFVNGQPGMQMVDILRFQTIHTRAKNVTFDMDAEKGYLQGRFDAVPIVDTSVARLKQLMED